MTFPFRNNPKIITNWFNEKTKKFVEKKQKLAYYDISASRPGWLKIKFREEKKRLGGSREQGRYWLGCLEFKLDEQFARDLKMFLESYMEEDDHFKAG